jgi:hypothetical protein
MDALARLQPTAAGLLAQVDEVLTHYGAPADHEVWPLLRRLGALPGDAVTAVAGWTAEPWTQQAETMRRQAESGAAQVDLLRSLTAWEGPAGEAFTVRLGAASEDSAALVERITASAEQLEQLAQWLTAGRQSLARILGRVLSSAEAVYLVTGATRARVLPDGTLADDRHHPAHAQAGRAAAAADIAVVLLAQVERLAEEGEGLLASEARLPHVGQEPVTADVSSAATDVVRVDL